MVPFPRGLMSRSVYESSTGCPALLRSQTAPPRSNYPGLDTLYPPLRRVTLQDFHFPEVFWVLLVFKIYFIQVQFIDNVVLIFSFFLFGHTVWHACGILIPSPEIELTPPAEEAQSLMVF